MQKGDGRSERCRTSEMGVVGDEQIRSMQLRRSRAAIHAGCAYIAPSSLVRQPRWRHCSPGCRFSSGDWPLQQWLWMSGCTDDGRRRACACAYSRGVQGGPPRRRCLPVPVLNRRGSNAIIGHGQEELGGKGRYGSATVSVPNRRII